MTRARDRELMDLVEQFAAGELSRRDFVRRLGAPRRRRRLRRSRSPTPSLARERGGRAGAGRAPRGQDPAPAAGRHGRRGDDRQAGQHGPGLRRALLLDAGLPEHLQQARLRRRRLQLHPRSGQDLDPGRSGHLGLRALRQRLLPQRRALHLARRRLHHRADLRSRAGGAERGLPPVDRPRRDAGRLQGPLRPEAAVGLLPGRSRRRPRDRQREGDHQQGPAPGAGRHRAVQVHRVGAGRPHHPRPLGEVPPARTAPTSTGSSSRRSPTTRSA